MCLSQCLFVGLSVWLLVCLSLYFLLVYTTNILDDFLHFLYFTLSAGFIPLGFRTISLSQPYLRPSVQNTSSCPLLRAYSYLQSWWRPHQISIPYSPTFRLLFRTSVSVRRKTKVNGRPSGYGKHFLRRC